MKIIKNNPAVCAEREAFGVIDAGGEVFAWGCTGSGRMIFAPVFGAKDMAGKSGQNIGGVEQSSADEELQAAIAALEPARGWAILVGPTADKSVNFLADLGGEITDEITAEIDSAVNDSFIPGGETSKAFFEVIFGIPASWLDYSYKMGVNPLPALRRSGAGVKLSKDHAQFHDVVVINYHGLEIRVPLAGHVQEM